MICVCTYLIHIKLMQHRNGAGLRHGNRQQLRMSVLHSIIPATHSIAMLDAKFLEDLSAQISSRISAALAAMPAADLEKNLRAMLTATFARLDLVTREDFDVQKASLARAQSRLATLEARLVELEARRKS